MRKNISRKGQFQNFQNLIIPIVGVGVVLAIGLLIMSEAKSQVGDVNGCQSGFTLNASENCCANNTASHNTSCSALIGTNNATRPTAAYNATGATQEAIGDVSGWLSIIIITVIGAVLIGLTSLFRRR